MPLLYYLRHGETDWNVEQRLQGHHDTALNPRGRDQAIHCGALLRDLFARNSRAAGDYAYVSSPLARARETMELIRGELELDADGYATDPRLIELSFGDWEGLTLREIKARAGVALAARDRDKWHFAPPGGESYAALTRRVSEWYASVRQDSVVTAHGGVARALIAHFHILPHEEAAHADIAHGTVYVFANGTLARYS